MAKGYSQDFGVDYDETFSPVFKLTSLRILLAIGAKYDYEIHQMDIKTAFLNGDVDTKLYILQPQGYKLYDNRKKLVCRLRKGLYGIKQAARLWNRKIDDYLIEENEFKRCKADPCIFTRHTSSGTVYLGIWVDDIILVRTINEINEVKAALRKKFKMTDLGDASFLLGISIIHDRSVRTIHLSQEAYIQTILE